MIEATPSEAERTRADRLAVIGVVLPALAALALGSLLYGFVRLHGLHLEKFRSYGGGWTTDMMPLKETQFFVAVAIIGTGAIFFLGQALARAWGRPLLGAARAAASRPVVTVAALSVLALVATALTSWLAIQHAPVLLDEMIYGFQAELLERGSLHAPLPDVWEAFKNGYLVQKEGIWTGIYPWGHVAALLPGRAIGFAYLIPHLCAPAAVWLTWLLGKELFGEARTAAPGEGAKPAPLDGDEVTPLVAAAVVATSPFVAFTCGTLHNVTTSMVLVTGGLYTLVRAVRRSSWSFAALAGLLFGLDLHSRPYNAISIALPAGVLALVVAIRHKKGAVKLAGAFALGLLPGIALYLFINYSVTGSMMQTPAEMSMKEGMKIFGFGKGIAHRVPHTPLLAFGKAGTNLARLLLWATGSLVSAVGIGGLLLGARRRLSDLVVFVPILGLLCFYYFFYTSPGFDTGPLYYLDAVPPLALALGRVVSVLARPQGPRRPVDEARARWLCAAGLAAVLFSLLAWWPIQGLAINRVTDNTMLPYRAVEQAGVHNAVVWFAGNPWRRSWSLPAQPPKPDLSDDVLYARFDAGTAYRLWEKYGKQRKFYKMVFDPDRTWLRPWSYDDLNPRPFGPPAPMVPSGSLVPPPGSRTVAPTMPVPGGAPP